VTLKCNTDSESYYKCKHFWYQLRRYFGLLLFMFHISYTLRVLRTSSMWHQRSIHVTSKVHPRDIKGPPTWHQRSITLWPRTVVEEPLLAGKSHRVQTDLLEVATKCWIEGSLKVDYHLPQLVPLSWNVVHTKLQRVVQYGILTE